MQMTENEKMLLGIMTCILSIGPKAPHQSKPYHMIEAVKILGMMKNPNDRAVYNAFMANVGDELSNLLNEVFPDPEKPRKSHGTRVRRNVPGSGVTKHPRD